MASSFQTDTDWNLEYSSDPKEVKARLEKLWTAFTKKHTIPHKDLRPSIVNSWKRCLSQQVNPEMHQPEFLTTEEVEHRLQTHQEWIEAIQPVIASVDDLIEISKYVIAFIDREGFVLTIYGNPNLKEVLQKLNFRVGANWNERFTGTTAVGIALATGQPSHVFHAEHYCQRLHEFTCTAVPIRDPFSQELIGVLDFVAYIQDHQPHAMGMALQMGRCVELEIYRERNERDEFFRECSTQLTLDHMERGVVILDSNDRIRRANLKALEYLNVESDDLLNLKFHDVVVLSDWKDREKPFSIPLPNGSKIRLERRPLVHQRRLIGSLILLESVNKASKKHFPPLMDLHWTPIGQSPAFKKVLESAENAARYDSNVLITGETGTGKEVIAHYIHEKSQRRDKPFVAINCGSIPRELLGSELFGYEAGAFTGAKQKGHPSKFELANGGTLLLDEISEMPLESQVYLLRVIEEKAVTRLGGSKVIPVDTRIIAAPGKNLHQEVEAGRFRADLLFRINVLHIDLPPLKGRKEDIPLLVDHFIHTLSESLDKKVTQITGDALAALTAYDWPGNVRELRNVIEQAIVMCPKDTIMWECLPDHIRDAGPISDDIREKDRERYLRFIKAYNDSEGNISQVAKIMDVSRPTVYAWKKKFGLD